MSDRAPAQTLVVIVAFRNSDDVIHCFEALDKIAAPDGLTVLVCENGGADAFERLVSALATQEALCDGAEDEAPAGRAFRRVASLRLRSSGVSVLVGEARENLGYAGGVNAWIEAMRSQSGWNGVWVLNPDTAPEPQALQALIDCARARGKGIVSSRVMLGDGSGRIASRGLRWQRLRARSLGVDRGAPPLRPDPEDVEARIDGPHGGSFYVTRACLDAIGPMDERYFLFFEDLELGLRAKPIHGVCYAFNSVVPHIGGTTLGSSSHRARRSPLAVYLNSRNSLLFARQNYPSWFIWTALIRCVSAFEFLAVGSGKNFRYALRGVLAGLRNETGRPDRILNEIEQMARPRKHEGS